MKTIEWLKLHKDEIEKTEQIPEGLVGIIKFTLKDGSVIKLDQGITDIEFDPDQSQPKVKDEK